LDGRFRRRLTLEPTAEGTRLQLEHRDLPPEEAKMHAIGWPHFLNRLATRKGAMGLSGTKRRETTMASEQAFARFA
jgi:hypothetical protein